MLILLFFMLLSQGTSSLIQHGKIILLFDHYFRAEVVINATSKPVLEWYLDEEYLGYGYSKNISTKSYVFATDLHEETSCGKTLSYKAMTKINVLSNETYLDFECHGHIHYLNIPVFVGSTSSVVIAFIGLFVLAYFVLKKKGKQVKQSLEERKSQSMKKRQKQCIDTEQYLLSVPCGEIERLSIVIDEA